MNGDFEVGLTGWNSWGEWDDGKYFFGSDFGDNACSGSASLKIICEKRGRGGVFTEPMYMPAGNYELRFWAKGDENGSLMRWTFEGNDQARAAVEKNFESDIFPVDLDWKEYATRSHSEVTRHCVFTSSASAREPSTSTEPPSS